MIRRYGSALALVALAAGVSGYNQYMEHELMVLWGVSELVGPSPYAQARMTETILWGLAGVFGLVAWVGARRQMAAESALEESSEEV